jgi:hypothetical protein
VSSSSGSSLKNWALGIIGAVVTAVLVFVIEQKLTVQTDKPNQQQTEKPQEPSIVSVNGQVFDNAAKRLLENVIVRVHISSFNEEQKTDSLGRYAFSVEGFDPRLAGSMQVEAAGFKTLTYNLSLQQMSAMQDLYLDAVGPAPPTGLGVTPVTSHPAAAHYVAWIDAKRISTLTHR